MADDQGVLFPLDDSGRRGTLPVNRAVWADAARAVDPELAARIEATGDWRGGYLPLVRAVTERGARSREAAQAIAAAGLAAARARLTFRRGDDERPVDGAAAHAARGSFATEILGGNAAPLEELVVPYLGELLRGDALRRRLDAWVDAGIIEPAANRALREVMDHPEWLRVPGRRVVLLGAGAETSPLDVLLRWGAEVVAVDLPRPELWRRLAEVAARGAGRVHLPLRDGPGADLSTDLPELLAWLRGFAAERPLSLGFYVYADGGAHVAATAAADVLLTALRDEGHDVAITYTGTPSDCYLVPRDVVEDSRARRRERRLLRLVAEPLRAISGRRFWADAYPELLRGDDGSEWGVADALVRQQGPNYALAKRLQRWRSVVSWRDGARTSFNVAPPTWTRSVTKNRLMAAGYYGARSVGLEVFAPSTMRTLMTALMVRDLHRPAPPATAHPERLVADAAVHGGYWRRPFDLRSTLMYTAVIGFPRAYTPKFR